MRPIAISLSPNTQRDDVLLALRTLFSPWIWRDEQEVELLEKEFAVVFGKKYRALAVNSGRSAEYIALKALGIGKGDEVLIQAFTCVVVPNSILWLGAKPVYLDVDESYNIDPTNLAKKISPKTKAIIVQHTFGIPANLKKIKKIAQEHNLFLIEDCAHSLGSLYQGKPVGSYGDIAFFSFGRDKVISSVFGGMVLCSNKALYQEMRRERDKLEIPSRSWILQQLFHPLAFSLILPLYNIGLGKILLVLLQKLSFLSKAVYEEEKNCKQPSTFPLKMPGAMAIFARNQLKKLERFNKHRKKIASYYFDHLPSEMILPPQADNSVWLRFPVRHERADDLYRFAKQKGALLGNWYKDIIMPAKDLVGAGYRKGDCPMAERLAQEVVNLPTYPTFSLKQAQKVVGIIKEWLGTQSKK